MQNTKPSLILWTIFLCCVFFTKHSVAQQRTISVDQIKPGMKGYGLTVFKGTVPERFEVEVVDVVPNFLLRQSIILIRCKHPVTDNAGVIGGMSGSPIYIEGKLAGALAYGWRFSKEPLAGVTPIQAMFDITHRKQRGSTTQNPFDKLSLFMKPEKFIQKKLADTFFNRANRNENSRIIPARTPVSLSGFSGYAWQMIEDTLSPFGLDPMQGGGGGNTSSQEAPSHFVDGGAIGVQMIQGDLSATGIGTVTTTYNGQVLAFGHPMFDMGESYLPVATAKIHTVIASLARSNKLGTPLKEIGSLVQDRTAGISARTDIRAGMIPIKFRIRDKRSGTTDTYKVKIANRQWLSARLIHSAMIQFIQHACSDVTDLSANIIGKIKIAGKPVFTLKDHGVSRKGLSALMTYFRPSVVVQAILSNPFEDAQIEWIEFDVELKYGLSFSYLKGIYLTAANPLPGEIVNLHARLIDYGGKERITTIPIKIPAGTANKKIKIVAGGGNDIHPQLPAPENLDDLLANVQKYHPANALVVSVDVPSTSIHLRGTTITDLPGSAFSALKPIAGNDETNTYKSRTLKIVHTDTIVSGEHSIQITVGRRTK